MDIKFCKTNLLIEHKELDGRFQFKFTHPLAGLQASPAQPRAHHSSRGENIDFRPPVYTLVGHEDDCEKRSLSSIELRIEVRRMNLEDWTSPKVQQVARESHEKMQKSMDKMVSKIKSLEKKVSGSFKKKKSKAPTFPRSRSLLTTPRRLLPKSLSQREGGRVPRPDAPARPPDSIESKQRKLNSIELRSSRAEEQFENPGFEYDPTLPGLPRDGPLQFEQPAPPRPRSHTL
ncbi:unnamed protein product [Microthlaspi erraticum]|uniref:Uncharacterized protein n=1 Tax=Microthlaspi erraticum TaxID=1685480 RepID=A0A6D2ISW9_9BRAS|nr:unnamed protein product [Microthlaspi erraticum]